MSKLLKNPVVRLVGRALLAGLLAFLAQLQAADSITDSILRSAAVGGVLAFVEWLTPLNQTVPSPFSGEK